MYESPYGTRWICFSCQTRFFDLNKTPVVCPKCATDQADNQNRMLCTADVIESKTMDSDNLDDVDLDADESSVGIESLEQLEEAREQKENEEEEGY